MRYSLEKLFSTDLNKSLLATLIRYYPPIDSNEALIDIVNVFRRSEYVVSITRDAIAIGAKALWLQDGIINEEASLMAKEAGLLFVMNDCLLRRHKELF